MDLAILIFVVPIVFWSTVVTYLIFKDITDEFKKRDDDK